MRAGHWTGSLALLLLTAGTGLIIAEKAGAAFGLLLWAFGSADLGLFSSFAAAWLARRRGRDCREAVRTAVLNGVVYVAAMALFVLSGSLRAAL